MRPARIYLPLRYALVGILLLLTAACGDDMPGETLARSRHMPAWYEDAKLGIFIHWGPASVPAFAAGGPLAPGELEEMLLGDSPREELPYSEWYLYSMSRPDSATREYHANVYGEAPYFDFGPVFEERVNASWDPAAWAELFHAAGARYVVLVTKHHDGYPLWPSQVDNPHQPSWGAERDMVGDLARAVRAKDMRFGVYYSTGLDWTFQMEAEGDLVRDMLLSAPGDEIYGDYVYEHLEELIAGYSPDVLWADIGYPSSGRLPEILEHYFESVPDGVVNDRWGAVDELSGFAALPGGAAIMKALARWLTNNADPLADDPARIGFKTAEYASLAGIAPFKWEATRGLGASFAYNTQDKLENMLDANELVRFVVDTVAKNGNVLINVGPDSFGTIHPEQQAPLRGLGEWLAVNGAAVYGTRPHIRERNLAGRELRYTRSGDALYAIVFGAAQTTLEIEDPGAAWGEAAVLGAQVLATEKVDGAVRLTLDQAMPGPAVVVRYQASAL
ncbi:MAG: alpha-L-fucosidase [Halioglobus sp.]|nr:alpha-L-fucosidase [Halioglobus sp.]